MSLIDQARSALGDIQSLVADNKALLHNILGDLDTLSAALGRNADQIDGLVAGMEKFLRGGPKTPAPQFIDLVAPVAFAAPLAPLTVQAAVAEVTAPTSLQTQRVFQRNSPDAPLVLGEAHWTDDGPKLIQTKLVEAFENAGLGASVVRATDTGTPIFDCRSIYAGSRSTSGHTKGWWSFSSVLSAKTGGWRRRRIFEARRLVRQATRRPPLRR